MLEVTLSAWEFKSCVDVANTRMAISNDKMLNHASTYQRDYLTRMQDEILGACGELAVCKSVNKFWSPSVNTFHGIADAGHNVEVRTTQRINGSLIVRDNDPDDRWYYLVVGTPPTMTVVGYIKGSEAKRDQWLRDPHKHRLSWFVPQDALYALTERTA